MHLYHADPSVTVFSESSGINIQENVVAAMIVDVTVDNIALGTNNQILQASGSDVNFVLTLSFSNAIQNTIYGSQAVTLTTAQQQSALAAGGKSLWTR